MLQGKVIILTGASAGIGRATVPLLAQQGANIVLAARGAEALHRLADEVAHFPGTRLVLPTDMSQSDQRERLIAQTMERFGRVDILINNAAVGLDATIEATGIDEARFLFEVNFFGPLHLCQLVIPLMRKQGGGQIVQVSSIVGHRATPNQGIYCATKYALNGLSDTLRTELVGSNILVTDIYPGVTATEFVANQLRTTRDRPSRLAVPPERVARVILSAIEQRSRARYIRSQDRLMVYLSRALPGLAEWALGRGIRLRRRTP